MLIGHFNGTIDKWVSDLRHYDLYQLLAKPAATSWSMGQLYRHLIEETNWYFDQIELCFGSIENSMQTMNESAKSMFQDNSFPDEIIKGDPFISEHVKQPADCQSLQVDFQKIKSDANEFWFKIENTPTLGKSAHPGLGFLNAPEWFQYAEMHMRHHLKQKDRIDTFLKSRISNENSNHF